MYKKLETRAQCVNVCVRMKGLREYLSTLARLLKVGAFNS